MNWLLLGVLAAYMAHATWTHWRQGPEADESDTHLHRGMPFPVMPVMLFFVCQTLGTPAVADRVLSWEALCIGGTLFLLLLLRQVRERARQEDGLGGVTRVAYVLGGLLQTALLGVSCYMAYDAGALGRSLFTPEWVILGLVAGHLVFGVSLCFSHRSLESLKSIARYLVVLRPLARFAGQSPRQLFACIDVSLMEEIIYRVAVQGALVAMTGSPAAAIVIVALIFSVVHRHFFYNHVVDSLEFLAFSLLLGVLYHETGSLVLVVLVHTVRNFEIVYFDQADRPLANEPAPAMGARA